jgi:ribosomal protein S18 acetylase RimI-like enzyme
MNEVFIRIARTDDISVIHDMAEVAFRHTYREILSSEQMEYMMDWMYSPANLLKQFEDGHVYHILFSQGRPCGYVSVQKEGTDADNIEVWHLQKIYVLPSEQGHGLGRTLFECAVKYIRSDAKGKPAALELNVNRNNPSIEFYRHLGLKILRQGDFHIGNGFYMNDYIMGADL